jgi:alpha-tubulin suppressor-like RCC1 family protein
VESLSGQVVTSVVCGSIHSTAVTETGDLYCWGFGEHLYPKEGQNFYHYPLRIPFKERVVQVACGTSHIVALTDKGDVYTWGSADRGQLGHGIEGPSGSCNTPRLVLHKKSIAQVSAGRYHTVALTCKLLSLTSSSSLVTLVAMSVSL